MARYAGRRGDNCIVVVTVASARSSTLGEIAGPPRLTLVLGIPGSAALTPRLALVLGIAVLSALTLALTIAVLTALTLALPVAALPCQRARRRDRPRIGIELRGLDGTPPDSPRSRCRHEDGRGAA